MQSGSSCWRHNPSWLLSRPAWLSVQNWVVLSLAVGELIRLFDGRARFTLFCAVFNRIFFYSRLETTVISGSGVKPIVRDKYVKFRVPHWNRSTGTPPEAARWTISSTINFDRKQLVMPYPTRQWSRQRGCPRRFWVILGQILLEIYDLPYVWWATTNDAGRRTLL